MIHLLQPPVVRIWLDFDHLPIFRNSCDYRWWNFSDYADVLAYNLLSVIGVAINEKVGFWKYVWIETSTFESYAEGFRCVDWYKIGDIDSSTHAEKQIFLNSIIHIISLRNLIALKHSLKIHIF